MIAFFYVNSFSIFGKIQIELLKNSYYIAFLVFLSFLACTKKNAANYNDTSSKDSLSSYLSFANDVDLTLQKREAYNQKAYKIILSQPNDSMNRVNLFKVANRNYNNNNWEAYKTTVNLVLKNAESAADTTSIAKAYTYLGDFFSTQAASDSAYIYYFKAEKMYIRLNDNLNIARTRFNKANLQYAESDYAGSELGAFKALGALKGEEEAKELFYDCYNLLGIIYNELEEYDKAIEYQTKALASIDDETALVDYQSKPTSLNNLGYVYQNMHKYKEAISSFKEGLKQKKDLIVYKPIVYAALLDNLAYSRFKLKESEGIPQLFYESLKLRDSLQLTTGVIISQIHLSEYFAFKKDTIKALEYSNKALAAARNSKNHRNLLLPLKQLAVIEPTKASVYNREYIHLNDSLQKADRKTGNKFSRIEYETDTIKEENTALTTQNRNLVYIAGSILILGLFLYIIKAQKAKNRELLYKQEQQRANEEIYNLMISQQNDVETIRIKEKKRVAQELHDGVLGRMFGVRMNLEGLNYSNDEEGSFNRTGYLTELKSIEQDIREISHDLNREKSELINNFVAILDNLLEEQRRTFKPKLVSIIDTNIKWESMGNTIKINLYRIVQESLQNINKYANANAIKVEFRKEMNNLFLTVSDDGIGFDVNKGKKGIGLQNMLSRINECNGKFEVKSKKGEGTSIIVTIPI